MRPSEPDAANAGPRDFELTAMLCHEISHPLTNVMGRLDMAMWQLRRATKAGAPALFGSDMERYLASAANSAAYILEVVRDAQRQARREPMPAASFSLGEAVACAVARSMDEPNAPREIAVEYVADVHVSGSALRISQVVVDLVANAVRAARDAAVQTRRLSVVVHAPEPGWAVVEVKDANPGIPAVRQSSTRSDDPCAVPPGLAHSRRILAAHGGRLEFAIDREGAAIVSAYLPVIADDGAPT